MMFFFIRNHKNKFCFFSSKPVKPLEARFSRPKALWEKAKQKLNLLSKKTLAQEQALELIPEPDPKEQPLSIIHSGLIEEDKIRKKFLFFIVRQRTKHLLFLIGEALLFPVAALAGLLPGPNILFGILVILIFNHWQAFRGISRALKTRFLFQANEDFARWEGAVIEDRILDFDLLLRELEQKYSQPALRKILWR
jgi:hypothetical protein